MAKVRFEIETDTSQIESAFSKHEKNVEELREETKQLGTTTTKAFQESASSSKMFDDAIRKAERNVKNLRQATEVMRTNGNKGMKSLATDANLVTKAFEGITRRVNSTGNALANFFRKGAEGARQFGNKIKTYINEPLKQSGKSTSFLSSQVGMLAGGIGLLALGKQVVSVRSEFEKLEAVLTNTLGSNSKAVESLNMIKELAASTPFDVLQLSDSFVRLANRGVIPTAEQLKSLGDVAATLGKPFDQLVEAILDINNQMRWKEVGIQAETAGDKVKLSFRGMTFEADRTVQGVANVVAEIGKMNGVAGSTEAISKTLGGSISNLGDSASFLANALGKAFSPALIPIINGITASLNGIAGTIESLVDKSVAETDIIFDAITYRGKFGAQTFTEELIPAVNEFAKALHKAGFEANNFSSEEIFKAEQLTRWGVGYYNMTKNLTNATEEQIKFIAEVIKQEAAITKKMNDDGIISMEEYGVKIRMLAGFAEKTTSALAKLEDSSGGLSEERRKEMEKEMNMWLKEYEDSIERYKKAVQDFLDAQNDLSDRVAKARIAGANDPQVKLDLQRDYDLKEIDLLEKKFIELGKLTNANYKLTDEQEKQFQILRIAIIKKYGEESVKVISEEHQKQLEAQAKLTNSAAEFMLNNANNSLNNLNTREQTDINTIDLLPKPASMKEEDYELMKEKAILEIQRKYALERLALVKASREAELNEKLVGYQNELMLLEGSQEKEDVLKREQIQKSIELIKEKFAIEGKELETGTAAQINKLQDQIDDIGKKTDTNVDLLKLYGIDQQSVRAINQASQQVIDVADQLYQSKIDQYENDLRLSQQRQNDQERSIESLRNQLEQEEQLNEEGKANNTDKINALIAEEQRRLEAEKAIGQQALEEKQRLQKEQELIDTASQLGNLVTATTNIIAGLTKIDPSGISAAIAVTAMLAGFVISKKKAFEAVSQNNFAEGVINLQGKGTTTSDSIPANLSRGESVMTAKETQRHMELFQAIRSGSEPKYAQALMSELGSMMSYLPSTQSLMAKKDSARHEELRIISNNDYSELSGRIDKTNSTLNKILAQSEEKIFIDSRGNLVQKNKTHKTILRK